MQELDSQGLDQPIRVKAPLHEVQHLIRVIDETRQRLAMAFSRERRLTADIAHELRAPWLFCRLSWLHYPMKRDLLRKPEGNYNLLLTLC